MARSHRILETILTIYTQSSENGGTLKPGSNIFIEDSELEGRKNGCKNEERHAVSKQELMARKLKILL